MQTKLHRLKDLMLQNIFLVLLCFPPFTVILNCLTFSESSLFSILWDWDWMSWAGFGIFVSTPLSKQVALMATLKVILQPTQYLSFFCVIIHVGQTRMHSFFQ